MISTEIDRETIKTRHNKNGGVSSFVLEHGISTKVCMRNSVRTIASIKMNITWTRIELIMSESIPCSLNLQLTHEML